MIKAIVSAALSLVLFASTAAAQTVQLKFSSWLPPKHFLMTDVIEPWMAQVAQVTDGRVKIDVLPKVVGSAASQFDVIRDGLADVSFIVPSYTPGRFVSIEFAELPLLGDDSAAMSIVLDRIYAERLEKLGEFKGVKVLSIFTNAPVHAFTAKKEVKAVEDLSGLKLRSPNPTVTQSLTLLGAVPILKSSAEAFEMLANGAIDGQITTINTIPAFNQLNLLKYLFRASGGLSNSVNAVVINEEKWAAIPPKDQEAILKISRERLAEAFGARYTKSDVDAIKTLQDAGYIINDASPEVLKKLSSTLKPTEEAWIARAKEKSIPDPDHLLADYRKAIADSAKSK